MDTLILNKNKKKFTIRIYDKIAAKVNFVNSGWHVVARKIFKNIELDDGVIIDKVYKYNESTTEYTQSYSRPKGKMTDSIVRQECFYICINGIYYAVNCDDFTQLLTSDSEEEPKLAILQESSNIGDVYSDLDAADFRINQDQWFKLGYHHYATKKPTIEIIKDFTYYKGICYTPCRHEYDEHNVLFRMPIKNDKDVIKFFGKVINILEDYRYAHDDCIDLIYDIEKIYDVLE